MTQKSYARQQRDARAKEIKEEIKTNRNWDELIELRGIIGNLFYQPSQITVFAKDKEFLAHVPDLRHFASLIRTLATDLKVLNDEADAIHAQHKDKTGSAETEEDLLASINLFEAYNAVTVRFDSVITPTMTEINEITMQTEAAMQAAAAAQEVDSVEQQTAQAQAGELPAVADAVVLETTAKEA